MNMCLGLHVETLKNEVYRTQVQNIQGVPD